MATENKSEILPWEPSPLEKQRQWLQSKMLGIGSFATEHDIPFLTAFDDPYYTRNVAENMTFASEFLPGFGDVQGVREGKYIMEEGSPKLGATIMGLSMLPLVPLSPIKQALQKGIKVSPTKVERTNTGNEAVAEKLNNPETGRHDPYPNFNLLKESRINFETNAERQLLNNPDFANPNKAYPVDNFIESTVAKSPKEIRTTVENQLDDWISPELRGNKATIQEILDDIGKNKPTIKENYMDDVTHRYASSYMPNIPTTNKMITNPIEALETINPIKYTERSFSVHPPNQKKLFDDPGHTEVGQGSELRNVYRLDQIPEELGGDITNTANRIFTTRSGLYDIDGQKVFIPAEGQSGIYEMGKSKSKAARTVSSPQSLTSGDIQFLMSSGEDLSNLDSLGGVWGRDFLPENEETTRDFLIDTLESTGNKDNWIDLANEQKFDLAVSLDELKSAHNLPDDVDWNSVDPSIFRQAELITQDNAIEYSRKLSDLLKVDVGDAIEPPLFKEWFSMHMKTSLNDAVELGADVVRFPVNPDSVARQTGQPLSPGRARVWSDELSTDSYRTEPDDLSSWVPNEKAQDLGRMYKERTNDGIKRIEAEYNIKLNPTEIMDDNYNEFLEIRLTPELKEAFKTVVYKDGGAVYKKPLMALKY